MPPQTEETQKSIADKVIIKGGMGLAAILTAAPFVLLWFMALGSQDVDFPGPDMVLYNNTDGEITIYITREHSVVVQKNSWGRTPHPIPTSGL